ncbi:hypothetical protein EIP91_007938, partial [Steccherinum ochraceum]
MSSLDLHLNIVLYGSTASDSVPRDVRFDDPAQRHTTITLNHRIPQDILAFRTEDPYVYQASVLRWVQHLIAEHLAEDIKHSAAWCCQFCNRPAREVEIRMRPGGDARNPTPDYVEVEAYLLCRLSVPGSCALKLRAA